MQRVDPYGLVGQVLDGQFRVDAPIGEGGCSVVYRGHHMGLDTPIAIKCLKLQQMMGTAFVQTFEQRFRDESKIQYRLSQGSLHIVRTLAAGTTIAPATSALVPYMVLEWLEGFTLAEQLRARRERGERGRPLDEVLRLLDPVAEAIAFAHSLGVVHRDLNPSNLFVVVQPDGSQKLKVVDFGVAKVVSDHAMQLGRRAATVGPVRMFTPAYGAPEQFVDSYGPVTPATDVYAFALLVVELLIDRPAVEGEHLSEYMERAIDPLQRPTPWTLGGTSVGESVEALLARALSVEPTRRPPDLGMLWGGLKNALQRDEEIARRRASQPPDPVVRLPGPTTKRGTLILRPAESSGFIESPSSSSIFADVATSGGHRDPLPSLVASLLASVPAAPAPPATAPMPVMPPVNLPFASALGGSSPSSPPSEPARPGTQRSAGVPAPGGPITVRPAGQAATDDAVGPTHLGAPPGVNAASPLSFTMKPHHQPLGAAQVAYLDAMQPAMPPPAMSPVGPEAPARWAGSSPGVGPDDLTLPSAQRSPMAPEPALTAPSSRLNPWLVVGLGIGILLTLLTILVLLVRRFAF